MSLVTVLRSPSTSESTSLGDSEVDEDQEDNSLNRSRASSFEGFFASKGAAYALPDGDFARRATKHGGEMQLHLQAMVNLLRDEDVLRLVVKLECQYPNRIRYLTIVSAFGPDEEEQSIVMGVDWTDKATIGLVVPLYRDTTISLDGDGGFKMTSAGKANIFKPISVQTMWTALQWIHKCADNARRNNYFFPNGSSHVWAEYYNRKISSDRVCLNEWHQMEDILSKRPESPIGTSKEKELIMKLIRHKLREVMARVDLEEVTSRQVRNMLEEDTQMELREYRSFIDEEMFTILGQMDSASKIFDHVYLGSEWNASNLEELKENGVGYILNITREIDNFFPGTFHYHNIRVYDLDETELLHHWDNTYKFIQRAKNTGSKVLVHCRMGISRSASTVIAYGMKEYGWSLGDTMKYVKARRNVVQPNAGFWKQLITYEGILNSSKHRYNKLFTNKPSETGAVKVKKSGNTTVTTDEPEDMDTVDNLPRETESDIKGEESSEEKNGDSEVLRVTTDKDSEEVQVTTDKDSEEVRVTTEDNNDVFFCVDAVHKREDGDSVEESKEEVEITDSIQPNSRALQNAAIEKTTLYRVSSVPALPSDDQAKQNSNTQITGNFQRSRSLRERGPKKVQQLRNFMEGRAASDENVTEFGLKKKGMFESADENVRLNDPDESVEEDAISGAGSKTHGSVPNELHGVLESGFVKRKSRNFEEGVQNVPSVDQVLDDVEAPEKEIAMEYAPSEGDEPTAAEEEQDQSVDSEEPEPGVVKKHKEEYELKHRESLKRGAVLQRWGSGDGSSLKRERGDGTVAGDADSKSSLDEPGTETERACAVSVDALVQKVNEDMKKEVCARRISKKEQELRAFVQQAGEQMKDALANDEDKNLMREHENSLEEVPAAWASKGNTVEEVKKGVLEDPQLSLKSADCAETVEIEEETRNGDSTGTDVVQAVSADVDPSKNIVTESTFESVSENGEEIIGEQDKESIPPKGLVKRHTLMIEGKLQPSGQKLDKEVEAEIEKEGEPVVQQEVFLRSLLKEATRNAVEEIEPSVAEDVSSDLVTESTETETCDLLKEREDKASEEDTESIPQKGLVKRHKLLIEERLQPLEQALSEVESGAEKESESKEDQEKCSSPSKEQSRGFATNTMGPNVGEDVRAAEEQTEKEKNAAERKETCEFLEDTGDRLSEQDVPQKGLVKRHTLLIEGKLQPVGHELDGEVKDMDGKLDDDDQDTSRIAVFEQLQPCVVRDVSAEDKNAKKAEETNRNEDRKYTTSGQEEEELSQKGLVKRHTLMIEGKLPPAAQGIENEDKKQGEATVDQEVCSSTFVDQERKYQIERTSDPAAEDADEENQDSKTVSGLVKREKLRIEKIVNPKVVEGAEPRQEEDKIVTCNDGTVFVENEDESFGDAEINKGDEDDRVGEQSKEQEQSEVGVDTSSVVRVKDHTQLLEGILQVTTTTKDGEKIKRQTSKEDLPKSRDGTPKIVIVPRSCSDERVDQENELSTSDKLIENRMEILSDSAVNIAILKAQENLDLENETFVHWDVANVKQRTRIFEEIMQHFDKDSDKDEKDSDGQVRRCGSMPKTIRPGKKYVLRRRSFSDLSETVSSSSGREVGYTIQFSNGQSSSSSSLPREWSPLQKRQEKEVWDEMNTNEVFSPEIYRQSQNRETICVELIDCQDQGNDSLSVKEKIQVLDSKNHRNITNVS